MQVEQVTMNDFKSLRITRSGGIGGFHDAVEIDAKMLAKVSRSLGANHEFELDAKTAEDLMHAVVKLAEKQPGAATTPGADMFQYDIELTWNGKTYNVSTVGIGADEALHGVIMIASRLIDGSQDMSLRSIPHIEEVPNPENPPR